MQILLRVALQNRYFILQKTLHELRFCDNFFFYFFFPFFQNNLKILRLKLTHMVVVEHVNDMKIERFKYLKSIFSRL